MFEWDEKKRRSNKTKHGVDFSEMSRFEWDTALVVLDPYRSETRFQAIGYIGPRLHVTVYTPRSESIRVISLRKANRRERNHYAKTQN